MYGRGLSARYYAFGFRGCGGSEQNLFDCNWSLRDIRFSLDYSSNIYLSAGVICQGIAPDSSICVENTTRLVNGSSEMEGRVEICVYGTWVTMCDNSWYIEETHAVCKQLGYPSEGINTTYLIKVIF